METDIFKDINLRPNICKRERKTFLKFLLYKNLSEPHTCHIMLTHANCLRIPFSRSALNQQGVIPHVPLTGKYQDTFSDWQYLCCAHSSHTGQRNSLQAPQNRLVIYRNTENSEIPFRDMMFLKVDKHTPPPSPLFKMYNHTAGSLLSGNTRSHRCCYTRIKTSDRESC